MASLFSVALVLSLALFFSPSFSANAPLIQEACKASTNSSNCVSAVSSSKELTSANPTIAQVIQSAVGVCKEKVQKGAVPMVNTIMSVSDGNLNKTAAGKQCLEELGYAQYRMELVSKSLPQANKMKDARAWMSASLAYQYDCWSALKYVNGTKEVDSTMAFLMNLIGVSTDALSMMSNYDFHGAETKSWGPTKTERDGVFGKPAASKSGGKYGVPTMLKPKYTVCKSGCAYSTVQKAVDAIPANLNAVVGKDTSVIAIKAGVYEEVVRVPLEKKNVVFLGDGIGKTVITGNLHVGMPGVGTYNTPTVAVAGDGFMATGVTFKNMGGPTQSQAVAFRSSSDFTVVENCEFLGNQDTLYTHSLRQFYKNCRIQGTVDFIFGNAAAYLQNCTILVAPRPQDPEKGEQNAFTAQGRVDPAQTTGFVLENCHLSGTDSYMALYNKKSEVHKNYLGRPWKDYARTVYIGSTMEKIIHPDGYLPWSGNNASMNTCYYGEFGNKGPGASLAARVKWSNKIPPQYVGLYSIQSFIQGDEWLPTSA